jgi:hypothetical protein
VRIAAALRLQKASRGVEWMDAGEIHRAEGIVVYFGFLLLLFFLSENLGNIRERVLSIAGEPRSLILRKLAFPLLFYYATTLAMPFLNGAYRNVGFWQHAWFVMMIPLVLILPLATLLLLRRWKTG